MKNLFRVIKQFALDHSEAIVFFSSGKDSIVTLDLCQKYLKKTVVIYLYYQQLNYREKFLQYYEKKYNIKILRLPHPELSKYYNLGIFGCKRVKMSEISMSENDNILRKKYNIPFVAYGYKKSDSLSRRGMIWHGDGIDKKNKKVYPVADFTDKEIFYYIKKNKLKLPPEYKDGFRDLNTFFKYEHLIWLKGKFPDDYINLKKQYPLIDSVFLKG